MEQYTPMMQAYLKTKSDYKDAILFYRLGDFYEMFFDDAKIVSKELELVLTGKSCGTKERAPMCGVPYHSAQGYISKLVEKGYKVAICEQTEDPKQAKGLVKREVVKIVTPGTYIDYAGDNALLTACIIKIDEGIGYALSDISTGLFSLVYMENGEKIKEELLKNPPNEIICNDAFALFYETVFGSMTSRIPVFPIDFKVDDVNKAKEILKKQFINFEDIENQNLGLGFIAGANLLSYFKETQKSDLSHMKHINLIYDKDYLHIDAFTYRNLELVESMRTKEKQGSLFYVLDKTKTAMGRRLLKSYIKTPLVDKDKINGRLDAIEEFNNHFMTSGKLRDMLVNIYDLERLLTRVSLKSINPKELIALKTSINYLPEIKELLKEFKCKKLMDLESNIDDLRDIFEIIEDSINDDAPLSSRDGGVIKSGYNEEVDKLRAASTEGKTWLADLEEKERKETGINKLRIKYNKIFGYYIEITNSYLDLVPQRYIRRQTLAGAERFYTKELKDLEDMVLGSKEKLERLEYDLFLEIVDKLFINIDRIQKTAGLLAKLDVLLALSLVSVKNNYVRPTINNRGYIKIHGGRHPVVEQMQKDTFIENDTVFDNINNIYLITGPNMAGKSTYMRQVAIISLMAHMGCFVPATECDMCLLDGIYTRVGASDDLASGQSTFMVEMNEMAYILKNATKDSLIILDEIGRGTSTYDGLSLAWSIIEYISNKDILGAKTMFATHYHELTVLEETIPGVVNYSCAVSEQGRSIEFLRKIIKKPADKSYGIQVADLAGIPRDVTDRATQILDSLVTQKDIPAQSLPNTNQGQLSFFDLSPAADSKHQKVIDEIKNFDVMKSTPMDALNFLYRLKDENKL